MYRDWRIMTSTIPEARVSQRAVLETLGTDKEHTYLAKSGMLSEIVCYGPFDRMPENLMDNVYWFGGWECRTPGYTQEMETHGITNASSRQSTLRSAVFHNYVPQSRSCIISHIQILRFRPFLRQGIHGKIKKILYFLVWHKAFISIDTFFLLYATPSFKAPTICSSISLLIPGTKLNN